MEIAGLDIGHIVELGTQVAQVGAIRVAELVANDIFDYTIGLVVLIYETNPG